MDGKGRACAVASLLIQSGQRKVVEQVSKKNNHVRIADLAGGPVVDWILISGLTQEECALIQPSYNWTPESEPTEAQKAELRRHFEAVVLDLRENAAASLARALERLLPKIEPGRRRGFLLKEGKGDLRVVHRSSKALRVRVVTLDRDVAILKTGDWFALDAGGDRIVESRGAFALVEWEGTAEVTSSSVAAVWRPR
jgi:hypothetical protein